MIAENIAKIRAVLPQNVRLVAVSKLKPTDDIREAAAAGQLSFGENYATELRDKMHSLDDLPLEWHFIGHLQSKQIKYYIHRVSMIHGVDSIEHLLDIDRAAAKAGRTVDVLLQVHVAREETKFGFSPDELHNIDLPTTDHLRLCGVMGMASNTDDTARVRADFRTIRRLFDELKAGPMAANTHFTQVSMGMSHDWHIAVDEGSTLVRIGSAIFGPRDYTNH